MSIALSCSSIQKSKKFFDNYLILNIVEDIHELDTDKYFTFIGESNPSDVEILFDKYPVNKGITSNSIYYSYKTKNYFPTQLKFRKFKTDKDKIIFYESRGNDLALFRSKYFYEIYTNKSDVIIFFKNINEK